jgi:hypothetical protein
MEPLAQLFRHERLAIAQPNDFAIRDPMNRLDVLVRDLAAADY